MDKISQINFYTTLIGLLFTNAVLIIGWIVTYRNQKKLLEISKENQKKDRELNIFRSRLKYINDLTSSCTGILRGISQLRASIEQNTFTFDSSIPLLKQITDQEDRILNIYNNPEFISIYKMLPESKSIELSDWIRKLNLNLQKFHEMNIEIIPIIKDQTLKAKYLSLLGDLISILAFAAYETSYGFSDLDKKLSEN